MATVLSRLVGCYYTLSRQSRKEGWNATQICLCPDLCSSDSPALTLVPLGTNLARGRASAEPSLRVCGSPYQSHPRAADLQSSSLLHLLEHQHAALSSAQSAKLRVALCASRRDQTASLRPRFPKCSRKPVKVKRSKSRSRVKNAALCSSASAVRTASTVVRVRPRLRAWRMMLAAVS